MLARLMAAAMLDRLALAAMFDRLLKAATLVRWASHFRAVGLGLLLATLLLELHLSADHDGADDRVDVVLLSLRELEDVESLLQGQRRG